MADENRRAFERTATPNTWTDVSVVNQFTKGTRDRIKVRIDNMSISGACIISEAPFELDQILQFHDEHIRKRGRVVWTCQSKIECTAGIKFENIDD